MTGFERGLKWWRSYPRKWTIEVQRGITGKAALRSFDCVVLTTDHDQFDYEWIADNARLVFDTRNAFRNVDKPHVYRLGTPLRTGTVSQVTNA